VSESSTVAGSTLRPSGRQGRPATNVVTTDRLVEVNVGRRGRLVVERDIEARVRITEASVAVRPERLSSTANPLEWTR